MPHDCERWQFEVWLAPDLGEESRYWSDSKREACELIKSDLLQRSIFVHLRSGLCATRTSLATDYGPIEFSVEIDGSIIRFIISKFDYFDPDGPGGGGHRNVPVDGLVLIVFGAARRHRLIVIHGTLRHPPFDHPANRYIRADLNIENRSEYESLFTDMGGSVGSHSEPICSNRAISREDRCDALSTRRISTAAQQSTNLMQPHSMHGIIEQEVST